MQEQAELYAASGRFREAYGEFRNFHNESEKLRSKEREARAQILQTLFDTEEAKRASEYYRNMALRDPLTSGDTVLIHVAKILEAVADELEDRRTYGGRGIPCHASRL